MPLRTLPLVVHGKARWRGGADSGRHRVAAATGALSRIATIREIHHQVWKNNLQIRRRAVAASGPAHQQSRRGPRGVDRIRASGCRRSRWCTTRCQCRWTEVNLDEVVDRILPIMNDVATGHPDPHQPGRPRRLTPIAAGVIMVITELVQNAIEHAFDATKQQGCDDPARNAQRRWLDRRRASRRGGCPTVSAWSSRTG